MSSGSPSIARGSGTKMDEGIPKPSSPPSPSAARKSISSSSSSTANRRSLFNNKEAEDEALRKEAKEAGVSVSVLEEMKDIFALFDKDNGGAIDPKEMRGQMSALGFEVDNMTIYQLISDLDSDGSQTLECDECFNLLRDHLDLYSPSYTTRHNYAEIFDFLDDLDPKNRDGKIDTSNLRRLADVLGDSITDAELDAMVTCADKDGKGFVSPEEFYELMVGCADKMQADEEIERQAAAAAKALDYGLPPPQFRKRNSLGGSHSPLPRTPPSSSSRPTSGLGNLRE